MPSVRSSKTPTPLRRATSTGRAALVVALVLLAALAAACGSGSGSARDAVPSPVPATPPPDASPTIPAPIVTPTPEPTSAESARAGTLDESFGDAGIVLGAPLDHASGPSDIALQPDGHVVVLADPGASAGSHAWAVLLARYDATGAVDRTFEVALPLCPPEEDGSTCIGLSARRLVALPDGRPLVLATHPSGLSPSRLLLFRPDGTIDASFGDAGILVVPAVLEQIALAPAGGIAGVGHDAQGFVVLRLDADLAPDRQFGAGGLRSFSLVRGAELQTFRHVAVQSDGRVLPGGVIEADAGAPAAVLARFIIDGELDPSFADRGWLVGAPRSDLFRGVSPDAGPIAIADDGRILLSEPDPDSPTARRIVRLLRDGSSDTAWSAPYDAPRSLVALRNGALLTVGSHQVVDFGFVVDTYGALHRHTADGSSDVTFGSDGEAALPLREHVATLPAGAAVQPDGKIVVACSRIDGGGWLLARFVD